jgi:hypothetical protein
MASTSAVVSDISFIENLFTTVLQDLHPFEVVDSTLLPYGLKSNTRSVSWIAEQIISQQVKSNASTLGLTDVDLNSFDTDLHNNVITVGSKDYYINIKIRDLDKAPNSSDIAAVKKLYDQYVNNPDYDIIYVCFGIRFSGNFVIFDEEYLRVFSPQFLPIRINRSINKLQANYDHDPVYRTRAEFLRLLSAEM